MAMDIAGMWKKVIAIYIISLIVICAAFFLPAGTLDYWQAWVYVIILFVPVLFVLIHFMRTDPEFLERRLRFKEKENAQKRIVSIASIIFLIGFLIPGLDRRFGWSSVSPEISVAADITMFIGYLLIILVFKENRYASRTIGVETGQTVVSTGPYAFIRHPMYLGVIIMYLSTPIALGSYWAILPFLLTPPILVFRILNEEEVLLRGLKGYKEYCAKVRYRLIPFVW